MTFFSVSAERGPQPLHGGGNAFAVVENRRPGHQHIGSRRNRQRGGGRIDPSVHLEAAPGLHSIDHLPRTPDLRERRGEEMLMPESRAHGHDQDLVEVWHDVFENRRRRCGIDGDPDAFS